MKKQDYQKPEMRVVLLQHQTHLLAGSLTGVQSTGTVWDDEDNFIFGGGSDGSGR